MIHRLLTSNKIGSLLLFPLVIILLNIPYLMDNSINISSAISQTNSGVFKIDTTNILLFKIIRILIIIGSSYILHFTIYKLDLYKRRDYYVLYWYGLFNSFFLSDIPFLDTPIANLFIILSLMRILSINRQQKVFSIAYDSGFFLGVAILINPIYSILILFLWIVISILKSMNIREAIWVLIGSLTPAFILMSIYYFLGLPIASIYRSLEWNPSNLYSQISLHSQGVTSIGFIAAIMTIIIVGFGAFKLLLASNRETIKRNKIFRLITILSIFVLLIQVLSVLSGIYNATLPLMSVPLSIMMIHFFTNSKKAWIPISVFYTWIIIAIIYSSTHLF